MTPNSIPPVVPAPVHPDQELQFLDLTIACHRFATSIKQVLPRLRSRRLRADQVAAVHSDIDRARAALDLLEMEVDACDIDVREAPIHLLENR